MIHYLYIAEYYINFTARSSMHKSLPKQQIHIRISDQSQAFFQNLTDRSWSIHYLAQAWTAKGASVFQPLCLIVKNPCGILQKWILKRGTSKQRCIYSRQEYWECWKWNGNQTEMKQFTAFSNTFQPVVPFQIINWCQPFFFFFLK